MPVNLLLFLVFICAGVAASAAAKKLTVPAAIAGGFLAVVIFLGVGWIGVALLGAFFLLGTGATSWQKNRKQALGLRPENKSGRNTGQVLANGGVGGALGLLALVAPQQASLCLLLMAGAFSSAAADTVSSEIGSAYGTRFYDVLTFRKAVRGADGVISLEGTMAGLAASTIIALVHLAVAGWNQNFFWILIAGTTGNLADSVLGATLERRGMIGNDAVNFLNTLTGAAVCLLLSAL